MYLLDTNVFLEILLDQPRADDCKEFINTNIEGIYLSDFSLHSIGVILVRYKKVDVFKDFLNDLIPNIRSLSLPSKQYRGLPDVCIGFNLGFDDAYQYLIAKSYELEIVTMDKDFERAEDVSVLFL